MGGNKFTGTLAEMFARTWAGVKQDCLPEFWEKGRAYSYWLEYRGPDCAPFRVYLRVSKDSLIIANIGGVGQKRGAEPDRKGRMPLILAAMLDVVNNVGIENPHNPHLLAWATKVGFKPIDIDDQHTIWYRK